VVANKSTRSKKGDGERSMGRQSSLGVHPTKVRLAIFTVLLVAAFVALYSRLWFLQVLAADDYRTQAKDNRVRRVETEPPRGRIFDRNGVMLVDNSFERTVTIDRQVVDGERQTKRTLRWLSKLIGVSYKELYENLNDFAASPYKPVPVATGISATEANVIRENGDRYRGVDVDYLPMRKYPQGALAPHILGYVGEISEDELKEDFFKGYAAGDVVGKLGVERTYDHYLRGTPGIERVVVDAAGAVVGKPLLKQDEAAGSDLILSIDAKLQALTQDALEAGILAARRASYEAPAGAVVIMDPSNGQVLALANFPTYSPKLLADGFSTKDARKLGVATVNNPDDDAQLNRAIQAERQPGSTFKVVTAGAALSLDVISTTSQLPCPGQAVYPPNDPFGTVFHNWTTANLGTMGVPESLEVSCDTFYYELGWQMETRYGPRGSAGGDGTERFQKYERVAGFGRPTGIDLPYEQDGRVPDEQWCLEAKRATAGTKYPLCEGGWLPGYTVNMAIGQGDLVVTPLQMAVTYAAIANGGTVWAPHVAMAVAQDRLDEGAESADEIPAAHDKGKAKGKTKHGPPEHGLEGEEIIEPIEPEEAAKLPLDDSQLASIRTGLEGVVSSPRGTASSAFAGFPFDKFPLAGKTGTAELGTTGLNDAWFISYGPTTDPKYVIAVYLERAGHGGESAAPIARQIWEGIAGIDKKTKVSLAHDESR
jgi:penicillin-binding protein 2